MQLIITDAWLAKSRAIHLSGTKLILSGLALSMALMLVAAGLYHWVFLKGAREGWPIVGSLVKLVVKDEFEQRDRFMRRLPRLAVGVELFGQAADAVAQFGGQAGVLGGEGEGLEAA